MRSLSLFFAIASLLAFLSALPMSLTSALQGFLDDSCVSFLQKVHYLHSLLHFSSHYLLKLFVYPSYFPTDDQMGVQTPVTYQAVRTEDTLAHLLTASTREPLQDLVGIL